MLLRSVAIVVFIAICGAFAIYVAMQDTVIKGEVMAANMLEQVKGKGVTKIECDPRIPVTPKGARFECRFHGDDGSTAHFEYTMDRAGALSANLLDSTAPTRRRTGWD